MFSQFSSQMMRSSAAKASPLLRMLQRRTYVTKVEREIQKDLPWGTKVDFAPNASVRDSLLYRSIIIPPPFYFPIALAGYYAVNADYNALWFKQQSHHERVLALSELPYKPEEQELPQ